MKKIAILGSTGSIGTQTLEVVENNRRYTGGQHSAAGQKYRSLLEEQIRKFHPVWHRCIGMKRQQKT